MINYSSLFIAQCGTNKKYYCISGYFGKGKV